VEAIMATQPLATSGEQLIPVFLSQIDNVPAYVCDGRDLHQFLEVGKRFASWITERIEKYGFEENQDFALVSQNGEIKEGRGGDRRSKDYHLSLDMAKELSMVENNEKGRQARRYFIEMEKQALAAAGQPVLASHQETLLPSEQQTLQEIARRKVENIPDDLKGKALAELWSRLHHKFRVSKYHQLPRTQFADALVYIQQMTLRCVPQPQQYAVEYITSEQYYKLKHLVWLIGNCFHRKGGGEWAAWRVIRQEQGIEGATKIPADRYDAVHQRLTEIQGMASAFRALVHEFETLFFRKNFGALPDETQLKQLGLN